MERPILFSAEMVNAILDGRKTQTRRVIKPQPRTYTTNYRHQQWLRWNGKTSIDMQLPFALDVLRNSCPYGQPCDSLWVRETWAILALDSTNHSCSVAYRADGEFLPNIIVYPITVPEEKWDSATGLLDRKWRPSIHMPRWASRLTLENTGVRVERVQDIKIRDAIDEGIKLDGLHDYPAYEFSDGVLLRFANLWNFINAKRGYPWSAETLPEGWPPGKVLYGNPWVWVIEFEPR